MYNITV